MSPIMSSPVRLLTRKLTFAAPRLFPGSDPAHATRKIIQRSVQLEAQSSPVDSLGLMEIDERGIYSE
jgi:hypothetical protein